MPMANASNCISPSWATSINCPMEKKKNNREKALSYQLVGVVISLFYCHLFSSRNSWPVYFQAFQWMQAIKFTADTQHGSSFGCSSCADWQKGSSSGKARFSDLTGITTEGSLENTEHCMWEILYHKGQNDSCESNTVTIKLLSNHFDQKTDLEFFG